MSNDRTTSTMSGTARNTAADASTLSTTVRSARVVGRRVISSAAASESAADVPPALGALVMRLLAKDPAPRGDAAAVAAHVRAEKLVFLSDTPGILRDRTDEASLIPTLDPAGCRALDEKCVSGLEPNEAMLERHREGNLIVATALNEHIGYDKAGEIVKEAAASDRSIREVALEKGVDEKTLDEALDHRKMAKPHE